jgi:hypothetical protein
MVVAIMVSLPPPPMTTNATLALIALALALPWTRIGQQSGGCAVMHLICRCHSLCHWRHLCLHLPDDGAKDDGCGNRQGRHANIRGQEEVGHQDPIGMEQQKEEKKMKSKTRQKQNTNKNNNSGSNVTTYAPADSYTPVLPLLLPLHTQGQQRWQHRVSCGSSIPAESMILSVHAESKILSAHTESILLTALSL